MWICFEVTSFIVLLFVFLLVGGGVGQRKVHDFGRRLSFFEDTVYGVVFKGSHKENHNLLGGPNCKKTHPARTFDLEPYQPAQVVAWSRFARPSLSRSACDARAGADPRLLPMAGARFGQNLDILDGRNPFDTTKEHPDVQGIQPWFRSGANGFRPSAVGKTHDLGGLLLKTPNSPPAAHSEGAQSDSSHRTPAA